MLRGPDGDRLPFWKPWFWVRWERRNMVREAMEGPCLAFAQRRRACTREHGLLWLARAHPDARKESMATLLLFYKQRKRLVLWEKTADDECT